MALLPGDVPGEVRARAALTFTLPLHPDLHPDPNYLVQVRARGATVRACGHAVCLRLHKSDFDRVIAPLAALREEMAARQEDNSTRQEASNYY